MNSKAQVKGKIGHVVQIHSKVRLRVTLTAKGTIQRQIQVENFSENK